MKTFLITWGSFCVLVIVGLFIAYATDNFPGVPVPQAEYAQGEILTEKACSPCEDNLKRIKEAMQTVAHKQADTIKSENLVRLQKTFEQAQKALDVFYHERNAENRARVEKGLKQYREAAKAYYGEERFDKALKLIAPERFERERRGVPDRNPPSPDAYSDDQSLDDSP